MCIVNIKVNEEKPHDMTVEELYTAIEKDIKAIYEENLVYKYVIKIITIVGDCHSQKNGQC